MTDTSLPAEDLPTADPTSTEGATASVEGTSPADAPAPAPEDAAAADLLARLRLDASNSHLAIVADWLDEQKNPKPPEDETAAGDATDTATGDTSASVS